MGEVPRPAPRNDEQRVDADGVTVAHVTRRQTLRGDDHAPKPPIIEREGCGSFGRARFHFDEGEGSSSASYDVDFATWHACATSEDSPALETKVPAGERLRPAAALFRRFSVHFDRSSARA